MTAAGAQVDVSQTILLSSSTWDRKMDPAHAVFGHSRAKPHLLLVQTHAEHPRLSTKFE